MMLLAAGAGVPELPSFISLLNHYYDVVWLQHLEEWQNIIYSLVIGGVLSLIAYLGTHRRELVPYGLQNFLELIVETMRKLVQEVLGKEGDKYLPFLGTLFIYILAMNWSGLVPLMRAPSSSMNVTAGLALCVFGLVQYLNIRNMGVGGFFYHMAGSPKTALEWCFVPLMLPIEMLTQISRPVTLTLRLFGNILGEDILVGTFALYGFMALAYYHSPIGVPLQIPFILLAILLSTMQALVFTLLSAVYILLSMPHQDH